MLLVIIIILALAFEFINGFHDTANVVATAIATKALSPHQAITLAAIFNFIGTFLGTGVALTISKGLIQAHAINYMVLIAALLSAMGWNIFTWFLGLPSSSSHALIGSLAGAAIANSNFAAVNYLALAKKVILPMIISPIAGFLVALGIIILMMWLISSKTNSHPRKVNNVLRELQVISSSLLALGHGSNDAQKTMSVITLALYSFNYINDASVVPEWVVFICALAMAAGTLSGGMKIIRTLSTRVAKLRPANGFAAELSCGLLTTLASILGLPISTTQAVTGSIMGAGSTGRLGINFVIVRSMVTAWLLTIPSCMLCGAAILWVFRVFGA